MAAEFSENCRWRKAGVAGAMGEAYPLAMDDSQKLWFDVVVYPHRSLSRRGFVIVMAILCVISFTAGMMFVLRGAWPVMGFFGLDVLAVYIAFRLNYRSGRWIETIRLGERELVIDRRNPRGKHQTWRFDPYWARVNVIVRPGVDNELVVTSHGQSVTLAGFLNADERVNLATALKDALARHQRDVAMGAV
ncbi:MAG: DUF2244 domain-containing protein [Sphingomonadales bacterium]